MNSPRTAEVFGRRATSYSKAATTLPVKGPTQKLRYTQTVTSSDRVAQVVRTPHMLTYASEK